ncbi:hypothetical protein LC608_20165 [Nostoc sp. XA010]|nr:hypothetical protein [Nostoc sp. XA010]MCC5659249.1 hypothetical protein [Nostoc sp. XA010]
MTILTVTSTTSISCGVIFTGDLAKLAILSVETALNHVDSCAVEYR